MPVATSHVARAVATRRGNTVRALVAILLGALSAELCVRLATDPSIDWDSIFSPGPYCLDDDLGFTSVCPNVRGTMRVMGTKIYSTFQKNDFGFRGPYRTASADHAERTQKVFLLGGQSQGFGYGLDEQDTYAAVAASHACRPVEIQNIGLVGEPIAIAFYQFVKHIPEAGDHVIAMIYQPGYDTAPGYGTATIVPTRRWWGERTAILGGWHFIVPPWLPAAARQSQLIVRAFRRSSEVFAYFDRFVASAHAAYGAPESNGGLPAAASTSAIREIESYAVSHGAKFTVFVLPGPTGDLKPPLRDMLPNTRVVDFGAEFEQSGGQKYGPPASYGPDGDFFIDGHFNKRMSEKIGKRIAQVLCERG